MMALAARWVRAVLHPSVSTVVEAAAVVGLLVLVALVVSGQQVDYVPAQCENPFPC